MLDATSAERVIRDFGVYDHAWPLYAPALGEPHLCEDVLVYTDGEVTHVAAFPIGDATRELTMRQLQAIVEKHPDERILAVNVWGRIRDLPRSVEFNLGMFRQIYACGYSTDRVEMTIAITESFFRSTSQIRSMVAKNRVQRLTVRIENMRFLSEEHHTLMREMLETHDVSPFDTALVASLPTLIRDPDAVVVEVRLESVLKGFALVWLPDGDHAVSAWSFSYHERGVRAADVLMEATIRLCNERRKRVLHLGYCETPGIRRFKAKWGAVATGPEYRETTYIRSECRLSAPQQRWLTWRERLQMSREERER